MIKRFRRIKKEFGTGVTIRLIAILAGLAGMVILDGFAFSSPFSAIIAGAGLLLGFALKHQIPRGFDYYAKIISAGLFIYGVVLVLGDLFRLENHLKLAIITATTVIIFNLQFWSLSDPSIVKADLFDEKK